MALFRKLFYRKPPDGLLEICERVYVFDCCFTTEAFEEERDYFGYVGGIFTQLREYYPDASILAFNFREGETQSQIGSALSEYDMTIMEYPRHYEGCPLLPMEVIHHFLRSSESWFSLGMQNLLLMHCERGGWPVLAFMLAALLIYRKHYSGELKTLDMVYKQAPRELLHLMSPLNPIPSQLRYLQYISRRNVATQWPPLDRALNLDCIIIRMIPNFDGEGGCRPIFRIYGQDPCLVSDRSPKVLFSTPKKNRPIRHYKQAECSIVKVDINCHIQGDVVLECISLHNDMQREVMMFRVMFNTAFIRSNILMLNLDEIDILWDAKDLFPKDFRAEVLFSEMDSVPSKVPVDTSCFEDKDGLPVEAFVKVQEIFSSVDWLSPERDAAVEVLQQLAITNTVIEAYSHQKSPAKSPTHLTFDNQSNLSPKLSPNADVSRNQVDPHFSPTKSGAIISSEPTLIPSGDSPPSSTSHYPPSEEKTLHLSPNQLSNPNEIRMAKDGFPLSEAIPLSPKTLLSAPPSQPTKNADQPSEEKTLHLSPKQQSGPNKIDMANDGFPLSEAIPLYPKTLLSGPSIQQTKDADLAPGGSLLSPTPSPTIPPLEDKLRLQNACPPLTKEIPSASTPPLKDDAIIMPGSYPSAESHVDLVKAIKDGPPKSKPPLSAASSAEGFVRPPPPIHSSSLADVVESTGSTTISSNRNSIQDTEGGHLSSSKTDGTLKTAPPPPASLPPLPSPFKENSECVVRPSSPTFTPYLTDSSAADKLTASCSPPPPPPPLPPFSPHESSSIGGGPPLSAPPPPPSPPLKEHYAPGVDHPPSSTPPLRDIPVTRSHPPPPPSRPPKESISGGQSTPPYSGDDASSLALPLRDSMVSELAPSPPPPPPQPPKDASVGGGPPCPPTPLHSGQGAPNLETSSPSRPPPSPASPNIGNLYDPLASPPLASPTTESFSVPSAPRPPVSPTTRNSSVPLAPPPPVSPTTRSSFVPSAPPPPSSPKSSFVPSAPPPPAYVPSRPPPPASSKSPYVPSAPPPPASPRIPSVPSAPLPPASPRSPSVPLEPPPPASPRSPSIPSAPPPPASPRSPSVPSAPPPPASPRSSSVPSVPPPLDSHNGSLPGPPSPPPPSALPPGPKGKSLLSRTTSRNNQIKKLKPLHWLKISRAVSGSLWAEAQKSGEASRAPEIDISELETLFSAAAPNSDGGSGRKTGSRGSMGSKPEKVQLIDHRRAYNCEIMLSKVKIPLSDMLSSVLALEDSGLDVDQVENLIKFCPTKEEMEVLKGYKGEIDKLGKCEQFFLELMQVPRTEFKLRVYSFKLQFHSQVSDLRNNLSVVDSAADQIRGSSKLKRIMQTILNLGNALNQGTARGSAVGFRLDSLLKLTETRARNNKMTLMHYLCKVLSDQLPELLDFWKDLSSLELASKIQLKFLAEEMQAINKGLEKVMQELTMSESDGPVSEHFCKALKEFLCFSEGEVRSLASLYAGVGRNVDSLILYFGEDPARCPFEQVISTLMNFVRMFKQAHEENSKQIELEKKKAEKEALERMKKNAPDSEQLLQSEVKNVE